MSIEEKIDEKLDELTDSEKKVKQFSDLLESIKELNTRITSQQIFIDSLAARIEKLENK